MVIFYCHSLQFWPQYFEVNSELQRVPVAMWNENITIICNAVYGAILHILWPLKFVT